MIYANAEQLKLLIAVCPYITEIRRAQEATTFFADLSNNEQREWIDELLQRTTYTDGNVAICLLDTGVTAAHPLLAQAINLDHVQAVNSTWGNGDHQGYGTEMAGIALYNNLKEALLGKTKIEIPQKIESVKILPPTGGNDPELYGAVTEQAVSLAEIANPFVHRVICMAVTSPEYNTFDGSPTSWSAAVDSITSGADEENVKRLFVRLSSLDAGGLLFPAQALPKRLFDVRVAAVLRLGGTEIRIHYDLVHCDELRIWSSGGTPGRSRLAEADFDHHGHRQPFSVVYFQISELYH